MKTRMRTLVAALFITATPVAIAQVTGTTPEPNRGQALVASKIASNYTHLAGSKENSLALVNALRTGTAVNLVTEVPPPPGSPPGTPPTTTTTTFTPPTKPMGWGNVKHSLALAQDQLARAGITDPTAAQLQTALMGGNLVVTNANGTTTTTPVKGILTMRADGMGWGNIAKEGGTKLGHVPKADMSANAVKSTSTTGVTTAAAGGSGATPKSKGITTAAAGTSTGVGKGPDKGITTASGATASHGSKGLVTASGASAGANPSGNAHGRGIVNAGGGSGTSVAASGHGKGHASGSGAGVVTGGGNGVSAGITTGGGGAGHNGSGKGPGNGKGKGA